MFEVAVPYLLTIKVNMKNTPPTDTQIKEMQEFYDSSDSSIREVGEKFGWNRHTLSKYLKIKNRTLEESERMKHRSEAVVSWRKRTKARLVEHLGGKCIHCGYKRCVEALEFHHKDPTQKDFAISGKSISFDRLKVEAEKCELVCSNCHKELHHTNLLDSSSVGSSG